MTVPRRPRKKQVEISAVQWAFLCDDIPDDASDWERWELEANCVLGTCEKIVDRLWEAFGEIIVQRWAEERPGTRPSLWWRYDAPRQPLGTYPGVFFDGQLPQPRKRVGGIGTPLHEVSAYVPQYHLGIPVLWKFPEPGPVGRQRKNQREFLPKARAVDPNKPPIYESQAAYLERHGLFLPGERERLTAKDFELVKLDA
jgi:hypothetical protein